MFYLGISLASLIKPRGCKLVCVIPERTSSDRIQLLKTLGVEIVRSAIGAHPNAADSSLAIARKLAAENPKAILIEEGKCTETPKYVVVGTESKCLFSGIAQALKSNKPKIKVERTYLNSLIIQLVFVEPLGSTALEDVANERFRKENWLVEDLGSHFKLDICSELVDVSFKIPDATSYSTARRLSQYDGILGGPSSGAVVAAAMKIQSDQGRIVAILNDTCRNYASTLLLDSFLSEHNLLDDELEAQIRNENVSKFRGASVEDLQLPEAVSVLDTAPIEDALRTMLERDFSQLPVVNEHRKMIGFVSQGHLEHLLMTGQADRVTPLGEVTLNLQASRRPYYLITPDTPLTELSKFFENFSAGFVTDEARNWCLAVVTKFDLLSFLTKRNMGASF
ncbi:hypothetical protein L0F63_006531 [Massospora cicadina]|nr:hypothetical protein L0F63_006531 [Massospora cicadina]